MNILVIRSTNGISGTEIYTTSLIKALLRNKDIAVEVITNFLPFVKKLKKDRISASFIYLPILEVGTKKELLIGMFWYIPMIMKYLLKIKSIEQKKKFDVILLESMTEKLFLTFYLKLLNYKVFWIEHGPLFETNRSFIVKKMYLLFSSMPNKIITVSSDTEKDLLSGGVDTKKIIKIYIGIDDIVKNDKNEIVKAKYINIGFLGNISKEKGITNFIDITEKLSKKFLKVKFTIIGNGPMFDWVKKQIKNKGITNLYTIAGFVENVKKYLLKIDIILFPTFHKEGLSLALLEALAMGKVVVARDEGGNRELIIDKKTGFLFNTDEEAERILEGIITGKIPIDDIRKNAIEHVKKNFNMKTQLTKFLDAFHG